MQRMLCFIGWAISFFFFFFEMGNYFTGKCMKYAHCLSRALVAWQDITEDQQAKGIYPLFKHATLIFSFCRMVLIN